MTEDGNQVRVFYSWQDDIARKDNRNFIEEALKKAIKTVNKEGLHVDELILDRDTKGVPGAPLIAETILAKIDESAVFVADVTIIGKADSGKPITNPNVMVEFGYALKSLTDDALVLVLNIAYGDVSDLPFDLRHRRIMTYNLPKRLVAEDDVSRAARKEVARELQRDFENALRTRLRTRALKVVVPLPTPVEQLEEYLLDPNNVRKAALLIETEVEKLSEGIKAISASEDARDQSPDGVFKLMQAYEKLSSNVIDLFVRAGHDDDGTLLKDALVKSLNTLVNAPPLNHRLGKPHLYPALLLLYAGGLAQIAGGRFSTLVALMHQVKVRTADNVRGYSAAFQLVPHRVIDERIAKSLPPVRNNYTPISTHLFTHLREPLRRVIKVEGEYDEYFVLFEYLFAIASALAHQGVWGAVAVPVGSYMWDRNLRYRPYIFEITDEELKVEKESWPPFKAGIFNGTLEDFLSFKLEVDNKIKKAITDIYPNLSI